MNSFPDASKPLDVILRPETPTHANFSPYGVLIEPSDYGKAYDDDEPTLDLSAGQPRFYIMRSPYHGLSFTRITRHRLVTQCLAAREDKDWFIAVAPPGASATAPNPDSLHAFHVPGHMGIKLHRGTWHAGPFFKWDWVDFFNLELTDTNQTDSDHAELNERFGITCSFDV